MGTRRTTDYSNQLDLFAGIDLDSITEDTVPAGAPENAEAASVRQKPARTDDSQTLEEVQAANGRGSPEGERVGSGDLRSAGEDRRSAVQTSIHPKDGLPRGLGGGAAGMGFPAEPEPPAVILRGLDTDEPLTAPSRG